MRMRGGPLLLALAAAAALLCGCKGVQTMLDPAGEQARSIDVIWRAMLWVCGFMYLLVIVFLGWAIWRARRAPGLAERVIEPATGHTANEPALERTLGGWAALIVAGLTGLILLSFFVDRSLAGHTRQPLDITVTANQWWWSVRYEDGPPDQYLSTANELHLPVDRPAHIKLVANDVIHSFWAPNLSGKQDLIPGRTNYLTVTPRRVGEFRAQCAEFCGLQHAHMALTLTVEKPGEFDRWRAQQLIPAAAPSTPDQMAGQQLFQSKACVLCHAISGTIANGVTAPDLTHIASRPTLAAGTLANNPANLKAWIDDPARFKPGVNMPKVPLSARELNQLVAYLEALK
jgi:cytochrome c oxidase subunit 2